MAGLTGNTGAMLALTSGDAKRACLQESIRLNGFGWLTTSQPEHDETQIQAFIQHGVDMVIARDTDVMAHDSMAGMHDNGSPLIMAQAMHATGLDEAFARRMQGMGYAPFRLIRGLNLLAPLADSWTPAAREHQIFFCRPDRAGTLAAAGHLVQQEPESVALPDDPGYWKRSMEACSFASDLLPLWEEQAQTSNELEPVRNALAAYAMAHDDAHSAELRYGYLTAAFSLLLDTSGLQSSIPRLCSVARIAGELGHDDAARQALKMILEGIRETETFVPSEPFLAVAGHYEQSKCGGKMADWIMAQALAQMELLQHPTSFSSDHHHLQQLNAQLRDAGFPDERLQRREDMVSRKNSGYFSSTESAAIPGQSDDDEAEDAFGGLPGNTRSRALMLAYSLSDSVKAIAKGYYRIQNAPEWMIVLVPHGDRQGEIAAWFEQLDALETHHFCILKIDADAGNAIYRSLIAACSEYHRGKSAKARLERKMLKMAKIRRLGIVEHDLRDASGMMLFDRLSPDMWRMLRSYYAQAGSTQPRSLVLGVPSGDDQGKITAYLQNMHQLDASPDRMVKLVAGNAQADDETFLRDALRECIAIHVPKGSSTPLQERAIEMAETMQINVVWHDEKPAYVPEPLPSVEDFRVTVVVLTYNRVELLQRAVESVLKQSYDNFTVKIFDDASSDGTEKYCRRLAEQDSQVEYHRNIENLGLGKNVRHAIGSIDSDLFIGLADDDFMLDENAMQRMVEAFRETPSLGMAFGQCEIGDVEGEQVSATIPGNLSCDSVVDSRQMMLDSVLGNQVFGGGNIYRRMALERMAEYATKHWRKMTWLDTLIGEGDYLCNLLMVMCCRVAYIHIPSVHYTVGNETYSSSQLGGGWSIEIRLRTVALLDDMYCRAFGSEPSEQKRIQAMVSMFESQIQNIKATITNDNRNQNEELLAALHSMLQCVAQHKFPERLRHTSKD